jgi:hypothetical protein
MAAAQPAAYCGGIDGWAQSASRPVCCGVNLGDGPGGAGRVNRDDVQRVDRRDHARLPEEARAEFLVIGH